MSLDRVSYECLELAVGFPPFFLLFGSMCLALSTLASKSRRKLLICSFFGLLLSCRFLVLSSFFLFLFFFSWTGAIKS